MKKKAKAKELTLERTRRLVETLQNAGLVFEDTGYHSGWRVILPGAGQGYLYPEYRMWSVEGQGNVRKLRAILRKYLPRWKNPKSKRCPQCDQLVSWDLMENHSSAHPSMEEKNRQLAMTQNNGRYVRELVVGGDIHRDPVDLTASIVTGIPLRRRT